MMEKSSKLFIAQEELDLFSQGILANRLKDQLDIKSLEELSSIIKTGMYEVLPPATI